ncbi:MAG TPA: P-loop NTPase fold protein, partial [Prolixibacteraceae bacterium]|nr:P-loop NTPase fold protein [Prolixibacteraceae bacterium]
MNLRHKEIIIDDSKPFSNCKLEREPYALVLTDIVKNNSDGFVLAINNEWGTGKTTFVKMWEKHLNIQQIKTLYFNAWENDFENDVLITLISELKELKERKTENIFKKVIQKAAPLAKSLALGLIETQIKNHVGNDFAKEALNLTSESVIEGLEEKIKIYTDRKNSIKAFKENLE